MTRKQAIKLFQEKRIRTVWDDEQEKWYFCVADMVEALTDSVNPTDYIKKMKKRDPELAKGWGQIVTGHLAEVSQTFADLTPLRLDKQATDEYLNDDLNYQQYDRLTYDGYSNSETRYNA